MSSDHRPTDQKPGASYSLVHRPFIGRALSCAEEASCPMTTQLTHDVEAGARRAGARTLRYSRRRMRELEDCGALERLPERPRSGRAWGVRRMERPTKVRDGVGSESVSQALRDVGAVAPGRVRQEEEG